MIKKLAQQVLELTREILESYWAKDTEPLTSHLHPDILWIGSMDSEYVHGAEAMADYLRENQKEIPPCHLEQQEYEIVANTGALCVVSGRYTGYTDPGADVMLSEKQRVTFVWVHEKDHLLIRHIHLSNTLHIQEEDERFPTKAGRDTYYYLQRVLAERSGKARLSIRDCMGVTRVLNYSDICYIKADHNYSLIYLSGSGEEVKIRKNVSELAGELPENFVMVSRSCCVNMDYVQTMEGKTLCLLEGTQIKVPDKKVAEMRKLVKRR